MSDENWREDPDAYVIKNADGDIVGLGSAIRE